MMGFAKTLNPSYGLPVRVRSLPDRGAAAAADPVRAFRGVPPARPGRRAEPDSRQARVCRVARGGLISRLCLVQPLLDRRIDGHSTAGGLAMLRDAGWLFAPT